MSETEDANTCFIIMPITTPESQISDYSGDAEHFKHVLEHIFTPAIEAAGLKPIPPVAKGSELIQAEIIKNLESAGLVLCDISGLNPNVFFELGIRTALNKPVCYVRDDITPRIPFDNTIVNHHTYKSALHPWSLTEEREKLIDHIVESQKKAGNELWNYFSLSNVAKPTVIKGGPEESFELLNLKIDSLTKQINQMEEVVTPAPYPARYHVNDVRIEQLEIGVRTYNELKRMGINTVGDLTLFNEQELIENGKLSLRSIVEINDALRPLNLSLSLKD